MIWCVYPGSGFFPSRILDPDTGSRGQKSTESRIRIRNTGFRKLRRWTLFGSKLNALCYFYPPIVRLSPSLFMIEVSRKFLGHNYVISTVNAVDKYQYTFNYCSTRLGCSTDNNVWRCLRIFFHSWIKIRIFKSAENYPLDTGNVP